MRMKLLLALVALAVGLIASPLGATPRVDVVSNWAISDNMTALGYSPRVVPLANAVPGQGSFNSDLAFWGDTVVQGTYAGFRLIDVTYPSRPKEIVDWEKCNSNLNTHGQPGRRPRLGQPGHALVELADAGADQPRDRSCRSRPPTPPATRRRARSAVTGRCTASRPTRRSGCRSAARRASTSSTSAIRRTRK